MSVGRGHPFWVGLTLGVTCLGTMGCQAPASRRERLSPVLDPRMAFREYRTAQASQPEGSTEGAPAGTQGDPAQRPLSGWDFPPCDTQGTLSPVQLGGLFTAAMPEGAGWSVAESSRATILVLEPWGPDRPTAYIYAEAFQSALSGGLRGEAQRFHGWVDRGLASPRSEVSRHPTVASTGDEARAGALPRLPAVALGYRSERGSFSGWRWIGRCRGGTAGGDPREDRPFLRLARTQGDWRPTATQGPVPASMVFGTATVLERSTHGVHLAMVCADVSGCREAPSLARFLGSIRIPQTAVDTSPPGSGETRTDRVREISARVGLQALPGEAPEGPDTQSAPLADGLEESPAPD